jgi:putative colanic acid biosynthesis acetyltransferase WcaF
MSLEGPEQLACAPSITVVPAPRRRVFRRMTTREQVAAFAWRWVQRFMVYPSPAVLHGWRRFLLRCFGARVDVTVRVNPTVRIIHPWNLTLGRGVVVCDRVVLDCQAAISIGAGSRISQFSHLCTATHRYERREMPIIGKPIRIGDGCWLAADVYVGCGVQVGDGAVVGARASVFRDVAANTIAIGEPAKPR